MNPKCEVCGVNENLQEHHISYTPEVTQLLCVNHHFEVHGKKHGVGVSQYTQKQIPENFEELWKTKTYREIMEIVGISFVTVYNWGKKLGLVLKQGETAIKLTCKCGRVWNYHGKHKCTTICPTCRKLVKIKNMEA